MTEKKFDPSKLQKLNDPKRLLDIPPEYVWEKTDIIKPDVLVEIGAGTAFFSIAFLKHTKNVTIYACDISETMIRWMKENVYSKYPNIIPRKMEENSVPIGDGIADMVYMINLHHELDNPAMILGESRRILKADGTICIIDWKKEDMSEGPPTHIRYLPEQVQEQLVNAGFKNVNIFHGMAKHFLVIGKKTP